MNKLLAIARKPDTLPMTLSAAEVASVRAAAVRRSQESITHRALVEWIDCGMKRDMPLREVLRSLRCPAIALMFKTAEREAAACSRAQGKAQRAYYKQLTKSLTLAAAKEKREFLSHCQAAGEMFAAAEKRFEDRQTLKTKLQEAEMRFVPRARVTQKDIKALLACKDLAASNKFKKLIIHKSRVVKVCRSCRKKSCSGCRTEPMPECSEDPAFPFITINKCTYSDQIISMGMSFTEDLQVSELPYGQKEKGKLYYELAIAQSVFGDYIRVSAYSPGSGRSAYLAEANLGIHRSRCMDTMTWHEEAYDKPLTRLEALQWVVDTLRTQIPRTDNWDNLVRYAKLICVYARPVDFPRESVEAISHETAGQKHPKNTPRLAEFKELVTLMKQGK